MTIPLSGYVKDQTGSPKAGLSVEAYDTANLSVAVSSTTTDATGRWRFAALDDTKTWAIKIIDGLKVLWLDGRSEIQFTNVAVPGPIDFIIDGGGEAITTGVKAYIPIPFNFAIQEETLVADTPGAIKIDIWYCTYAQYDISTHPVNGDSICGGNEPEIAASGVKDQDATLTSWTKNFNAGILAINVDSCTSITLCTLSLKVMRT